MANLSSFIAAGLASILAWDFYVAPRALDTATSTVLDAATTSRSAAPEATFVDRTRKGDRLGASSAPHGPQQVIARMDVGPGDAIRLLSRSGDMLFAMDPAGQRTVVAKNVVLPQLTLQASPPRAPAVAPEAREPSPPKPTLAPDPPPSTTTVSTGRKPELKRPAGCDPAFSPIAAPELGHIFGRCVTSIDAPTRLAFAQ